MEIAALCNKISRRTALGSATALIVSPALAEECRIGPPPHPKGPLVWMDMDQMELDAAYDQAFYAPLRIQNIKRWASSSEAARARIGQPMRESYGPTAVEKLDIYRSKRAMLRFSCSFTVGRGWAERQRITPFQQKCS
jgi:arylformamidase